MARYKTGTNFSPGQNEIALYWVDDIYKFTPQGMFRTVKKAKPAVGKNLIGKYQTTQ